MPFLSVTDPLAAATPPRARCRRHAHRTLDPRREGRGARDPGERPARRRPLPRPTTCSKAAGPATPRRSARAGLHRRALRRPRPRARRARRLLVPALRARGRHARTRPQVAPRAAAAARAPSSRCATTTSPYSGVRGRRGAASRTPRSSSSATASWRPSTSGTTSRAPTSRARSSLVMNNDPDGRPDALRRQDPALLRPLGLQVRDGRAAGRGRRDHHPHDALGRLPLAGRADVLERRELHPARRRASRSVQVTAWMTEDASRRLARLAGQDLDALRAAAQKRDFKPVPLGVTISLALENDGARRRRPPT